MTARHYLQAAALAAYWSDLPRDAEFDADDMADAKIRASRVGWRLERDRSWHQHIEAEVSGAEPRRRLLFAVMAVAERHCLPTARCSGCPLVSWCEYVTDEHLHRAIRDADTPSPQLFALCRSIGAPRVVRMLDVDRQQIDRWCLPGGTMAPQPIETWAAAKLADVTVIEETIAAGIEVEFWTSGVPHRRAEEFVHGGSR